MPTPKKKAPAKRKAGHPKEPVFTQAVAEEVCDRLAKGESLRQICKDSHLPDEKTIRYWAAKADHPFSAQYSVAREVGYLSMADELLEIADDGSNDWMVREGKDGEPSWILNGENIQRSRLRVDTRKWVVSKMLPRIFGDKVINEHSGPDGGPIQTETTDSLESARRVAFLLGTAVAKAKARSDEPSE
jgi:hypothetical protein